MTIRTPYLIQRAEIKSPLEAGTARLSEAVSFDYMGSAEFEFGALPKSFRALQSSMSNWKLVKIADITEGEAVLRVLHALSDEDFTTYVGYLKRMRGVGDSLRLKERSGFDLKLKSSYDKANFWWDIENHVMFSFHKIFMNRLDEHLKSSFKYMDEKKAQ